MNVTAENDLQKIVLLGIPTLAIDYLSGLTKAFHPGTLFNCAHGVVLFLDLEFSCLELYQPSKRFSVQNSIIIDSWLVLLVDEKITKKAYSTVEYDKSSGNVEIIKHLTLLSLTTNKENVDLVE
jgi:hypothetical protein